MRRIKNFELATRGFMLTSVAVALLVLGLLAVDGVMLALGLGLLGLLGLAQAVGWWNLRGLQFQVEGPAIVRAGSEIRLRTAVINHKRWLGSVGLRGNITLPGKQALPMAIPWVGAETEAAKEIRVVAKHRGVMKQMTGRVTTHFPLGLWRVSRMVQTSYSLVVLPRAQWPDPESWRGAMDESAGRVTKSGLASVDSFRGLRAFQPGDRARSIAWAASLRWQASGRGMWLVKDWDPPGHHITHWEILFHSHGGNRALIQPGQFESALSQAWGWVEYLFGHGAELTWRADFDAWMPHRVRTRAELGMLGVALAAAQRCDATERHELEARIAEAEAGAALIISDMPGSAWPGPWHDDPGYRVIDGLAAPLRTPKLSKRKLRKEAA